MINLLRQLSSKAFLCLLTVTSLVTVNGHSCFAGHFHKVEAIDSDDGDTSLSSLRAQATQESLGKQYEQDLGRLIDLRSHPLEEVLAFCTQLERKWRQLDWNFYARMIIHVCSEISNREVNDARLRKHAEDFAKIALSHSRMFLWEHEADLVGALTYQRSSSTDSSWLQERREKTRLWLQAWRRFEEHFDAGFNINDPRNRPLLRVFPPAETGLPAGTSPSAIKDPKLREQYQAAIAENEKKSKRANQQSLLIQRGPGFKANAERTLIQLYSQPPASTAELKRYLVVYMKDEAARRRIVRAVEMNK